jgi:hypothetical protein
MIWLIIQRRKGKLYFISKGILEFTIWRTGRLWKHEHISQFLIIIMKYLRQAGFIKKRGLFTSQFWRLEGQIAWGRLWSNPMRDNGVCLRGSHISNQKAERDWESHSSSLGYCPNWLRTSHLTPTSQYYHPGDRAPHTRTTGRTASKPEHGH